MSRTADEELLATLGYKQEFTRAFSALEVFGIAFSIIGLLPSIASVLVYAIPNGGASAMVRGLSNLSLVLPVTPPIQVWGWAVASVLILFVGMSMAELASSAPMSGGLYYWTYTLYSPNSRNLLSWIVGCTSLTGTFLKIQPIYISRR
jgi:amino acid transporter